MEFLDSDKTLVEGLRSRGSYSTYMCSETRLREKRLITSSVFHTNAIPEDLDYDVAFVAVGPAHCSSLPTSLSRLDCPVLVLENDPHSTRVLESRLGWSNLAFAIPDVIASSTASPEHLLLDPFALHTEDGYLYVDVDCLNIDLLRSSFIRTKAVSKDEMSNQWLMKLYLHNTPHCVAAYLGALGGIQFIHEAMQNRRISDLVEGVLEEMLLALKLSSEIGHATLEAYASKELTRFRNHNLFDPIARVAREPVRKLQPGGRLMGALRTALLAGVLPISLCSGIVSAIEYYWQSKGPQKNMNEPSQDDVATFLKFHADFIPNQLESLLVVSRYEEIRTFLYRIFP